MTINQANSLLLEYVSPDRKWSVIFDDNGHTGYAYARCEGDIVSDVWLYNRGEAPIELPWHHPPDDLPYENPREFTADTQFTPPAVPSDISVEWRLADSPPTSAVILLRGMPIGMLTLGSKPGWAKFAKKDGPLAKVLTEQLLSNST